jgi:hypothetical protein
MACFEELLRSFTPRPGVQYLTFMHNHKARLKAQQFSPPLAVEEEVVTLFQDICDVHQRRNVNRSIEESMQTWPELIAQAQSRGVRRARAGIAATHLALLSPAVAASCPSLTLAHQPAATSIGLT